MIVVLDDKLRLYSFPAHPFNSSRYDAFINAFNEFKREGKLEGIEIIKARKASKSELLLFHTKEYIQFVKESSSRGYGLLDYGDTPAFPGCYEAGCYVVGAVLNAVDAIFKKNQSAFVPIAGLHHAYPDRAAGFCIFNDIGIAINYLRKFYGINKALYFDIDAHHGDGVFYSFIADPNLYIVDFHQMPLYPGTGYSYETGEGKARGTKLNLPLSPGSTDKIFQIKLEQVKKFLTNKKTEFIIMQAGADSMAHDYLASLMFEKAHTLAARFLLNYAKKWNANILVLGGGGYNNNNVANAWMQVISEIAK
ncbi:MAG: acetoin utilization protein AcuC [Candidatus Pacearchaeota archaeon]